MNCLSCLKELRPNDSGEYHKACVKKVFGAAGVSLSLPFSKRDLKIELLKPLTEKMSISGAQIKLSLKVSGGALTATGAGGGHILKPSPPEFPHIAENEHLAMLIGKLLGIKTPPLALIRLRDGEPAYIIKRFDRSGRQKLRCEDLCQIFGVKREEKYSKSYEDAGRKILGVTNGNLFCAGDFLRRLVFNYLIANGDFHLKNISLVSETGARLDSLSPNYDSVNTRVYLPDEAELALEDGLLSGGEFTREYSALGFYSRADFRELGLRLGIPEAAFQSILETVSNKRDDIFSLVKSSFLSDDMKSAYAAIVEKQLKKLFASAE
jgi:serine/threonine-protein kinase HipA